MNINKINIMLATSTQTAQSILRELEFDRETYKADSDNARNLHSLLASLKTAKERLPKTDEAAAYRTYLTRIEKNLKARIIEGRKK